MLSLLHRALKWTRTVITYLIQLSPESSLQTHPKAVWKDTLGLNVDVTGYNYTVLICFCGQVTTWSAWNRVFLRGTITFSIFYLLYQNTHTRIVLSNVVLPFQVLVFCNSS
uniref:Putative ovule protein n=1 Tax=Solanum chacoense TaxID=4108 RepID=A0A0V0HG92_SOLCH